MVHFGGLWEAKCHFMHAVELSNALLFLPANYQHTVMYGGTCWVGTPGQILLLYNEIYNIPTKVSCLKNKKERNELKKMYTNIKKHYLLPNHMINAIILARDKTKSLYLVGRHVL